MYDEENHDCDNGEEMDSTLQVAKMALFLTSRCGAQRTGIGGLDGGSGSAGGSGAADA
jgi:hypothetical protein